MDGRVEDGEEAWVDSQTWSDEYSGEVSSCWNKILIIAKKLYFIDVALHGRRGDKTFAWKWNSPRYT